MLVDVFTAMGDESVPNTDHLRIRNDQIGNCVQFTVHSVTGIFRIKSARSSEFL